MVENVSRIGSWAYLLCETQHGLGELLSNRPWELTCGRELYPYVAELGSGGNQPTAGAGSAVGVGLGPDVGWLQLRAGSWDFHPCNLMVTPGDFRGRSDPLVCGNESCLVRSLKEGWAVLAHAFNCSTWETEASGLLNLRPAWST